MIPAQVVTAGQQALEKLIGSVDGVRVALLSTPDGFEIASLRTNLPLLKGASLIEVDIRQFGIFEPDKSATNRDTVFGLAAEGTLRPAIARSYALADFQAAMADAAAGKSAGRIVLTMD